MGRLGSFHQGSVVSRRPLTASPLELLGLLRLGPHGLSAWLSLLSLPLLSLRVCPGAARHLPRFEPTGQPPRAWRDLEFGSGWAGGDGGSGAGGGAWGLRVAAPVTQNEGCVPTGPADSHGVDGLTTLSLICWLFLEGARTVLSQAWSCMFPWQGWPPHEHLRPPTWTLLGPTSLISLWCEVSAMCAPSLGPAQKSVGRGGQGATSLR